MVYPGVSPCVCECSCVCVHDGVRLIEVVRVKMIPSVVEWGVYMGQDRWRWWMGSAMDDGKRDEMRRRRGESWGGVKQIAPHHHHPHCSEAVIHEHRQMK